MVIAISRKEGVTVLTMKTDPNSVCPPLCQLLKDLVYNPLCCGISQHLKTRSLSVLGTLQVMVSAMVIGLSAILCNSPGATWWQMDYTGFPFWLSGVFVAFGIFAILSERFSSPCLVIVNVILQLLGVFFGIASVVLFSINITEFNLWDLCDTHPDYYDYERHQNVLQTTTLPPQVQELKQKCLDSKDMLMILILGINGMLIVLSALQLCISICSATFGIKALKNREKKQKESSKDSEPYQPLLEEVLTNTD